MDTSINNTYAPAALKIHAQCSAVSSQQEALQNILCHFQ